jgi:hypothetical protein
VRLSLHGVINASENDLYAVRVCDLIGIVL